MNNGTLTLTHHNKVATLTFGHPAGNSFPSTLLSQLVNTLESVKNTPEITVLILKSQGEKVFCSGASFDELLQIQDLQKGSEFFSGFARVINTLRKLNVIVVGIINGKSVGGGVGIAAACDYTFAAEDSSIKLSELAIGIGPFVIEPAITRKIGKTAFSTLCLQPNQWQSAQWAFEKGLFNQIIAKPDLHTIPYQFAEQLSQHPSEALAAIKKMMWENTENWDNLLPERAKISGKLVLSEETKTILKHLKPQK